MKRKTMISLVLAVLLILAGGILFVCTMAALRWDFTGLSTKQYETNTYEIREACHSIAVNTDTADIFFVPSPDAQCRVVCTEETDAKHSVAVKEGTLTIELVENKTVSDYIRNIRINFGSPQITVYLPQTEYKDLVIREDTGDIVLPAPLRFESVDIGVSTGDITCSASASGSVKIKTTTGEIRIENASAENLELTVSTGDVHLENLRCKGLQATGNTGDISLKNVIAQETVSIMRTTGDVRFDGADAAAIFVETDTGDVTGTLLTDKVFVTHTSTGDIDVPKTTAGGRCEITTSTGDIRLTVK